MIRVDDDGRFDTEYRLDVEIDHALATHVKFRLFELVQGQFRFCKSISFCEFSLVTFATHSLALLVDVGLMFGGAIETFLSVGRVSLFFGYSCFSFFVFLQIHSKDNV